MLNVQLDEEQIRELFIQKIEEQVTKTSLEFVFWDTPELKRRTCMSWNTMQENFFHDPDFPKVKIGGKWYFPAREAEAFLLDWYERKRKNAQ